MSLSVTVVGGGLAGSEAAWQLAQRGYTVKLYEMRPHSQTGAHTSGRLAELVCSNSFGSQLSDRATGLLKIELHMLRCHLIECAERSSVPAGGALAVDRDVFSTLVTQTVTQHPLITLIREEVRAIPDGPVIIASGPLTSEALTKAIGTQTGSEHLYFYDALAPIVTAESINLDIAFRASRYGRGENSQGDYINCPMSREEYERFVDAILNAEKIELRAFEAEDEQFFEGCLPIEQIASRGRDSLAFGPMRPVGLIDPRTGQRPYAIVQLRQDNLAGTLYNLVGFQTNIRWGDQQRILRMVPGLENAEFVRLGQMHRNTFINSPTLLEPWLALKGHPSLFFAGQIAGVEGYMGNVATGLVAALNLARHLEERPPWVLPPTTMLGALCNYVAFSEPRYFQPMKANFGILPPLTIAVKDKRLRYQAYVERALKDLRSALSEFEVEDRLFSQSSETFQ
ncbi:MAG: methylenetetrahydrofolate--tRNA-(uracil(54)-C(5))-methyltransferase (FADH(2)-oxidizing) TrmFO [Anaerolineae bacterium]|nr:methylenetetrahydrofolate--tRNA-(uracil(54)-C(5))-methyltransferase (FADH(2)-oxidizing) TrmFO [Anaerolineae bacterium]NUQ02507.1 methylenetetrahydrofolate--tRNA-(uracil(54)-C(5))-methyltransferase (FADH(2)-oxidizing) TrmFO [Anaerolineae bacterium]